LGRPLDRPHAQEAPTTTAPAPSGNEDTPDLKPFTPPLETETTVTEGGLRLNVYEIDSNPFQPRRDFAEDEIQGLADSLKEHGLIQPLVVRRVDDRYQLIAGERRLRAAIKAGWSEVPAQLKEADDREMAELAIVENLQRKDLNALEKAASFQKYLQRYGATQEELARRLSIDRSTVSNLIRLLELPEAVQDALRSGSVSQGHARALLPLGDQAKQIDFCRRIASEGLSVRATEAMVHDMLHAVDPNSLGVVSPSDSSPPPRTRSEHLASLEQQLRTSLGAKIELRQTAKGRGRIIIHFTSHDEFNRLHEQICGRSHQDHREAG